MRKSFYLTILGVLCLGVLYTASKIKESVAATPTSTYQYQSPRIGEIVMGNPKAPLKIIMYYALACPHCADFHENIFPRIKSKFIDTQKVYFVMRSFVLDEVDLKATQLAWCFGKEKALSLSKLLMDNQDSWNLTEKDITQHLIKVVKGKHGITADQCRKCFKNEKLENQVLNIRLEADKNKELILYTPAFIVNDKLEEKEVNEQYIMEKLKKLDKECTNNKGG